MLDSVPGIPDASILISGLPEKKVKMHVDYIARKLIKAIQEGKLEATNFRIDLSRDLVLFVFENGIQACLPQAQRTHLKPSFFVLYELLAVIRSKESWDQGNLKILEEIDQTLVNF